MEATLEMYGAEDFCRLFSAHMKLKDSWGLLTLLRNLQTEQKRTGTKAWENRFKEFCRKMVKLEYYEVFFGFTSGLFACRKQVDMQLLKGLLSDVEVREDYDLAQLCQDFAMDLHDGIWLEEARFGVRGSLIDRSVDLYEEEVEVLPSNSFDGVLFRKVTVWCLLKRVYGVEVPELEHVVREKRFLRREDVDAVAVFVLRKAEAAYEAYRKDVEAWNLELEQYGVKQRQVPKEFTDYMRTKALPGALIPFLRMTEVTVDMPNFYHILQEYFLPALTKAEWLAKRDLETLVLANIAQTCTHYLSSAVIGELPVLRSGPFLRNYAQIALYREMLGKGESEHFEYVTDRMKQYSREHSRVWELWADVLQRSGNRLKQAMEDADYSSEYPYHILEMAWLMFFSGREEAAARFLLQHHGALDDAQRRGYCYLILLTRCIMCVSRLDNANALYGLFSYEMDRMIREHNEAVDHARQMIRYVRDVEAYLHGTCTHSIVDRLTYHEIVFGDGKILSDVDAIETNLRRSGRITRDEYRCLVRLTEAFCYQSGIRLPLLGLPRVDDCDKLYDALSKQLVREGQLLMKRYQEFKLYWENVSINNVLRDVNLHLQNHLFKKQCEQVRENLQRVSELKRNMPVLMTEEDRKNLLDQIERIAEDLMNMMLASRQGRSEVELELTMLREQFEQTYLSCCENLMEKLPMTAEEPIRDMVQNYLVTSALVYRMMASQKDASLDYSPALISLTKALELVMHHVYTRLDVRYDESFRVLETDKKRDMERKRNITEIYFNKELNKKEKLTLRPYVEVLSSDRFALWGGDQVLDIDMLSRFRDIPIRTRKKGSVCYFTDDADENRRHLKQALVYICENYRNRTAHTDAVTLMEVEECHQLLIDGQKMLWILLAILK